MKISIYIILFFISISITFAQSDLDRKYQFARSYLDNGQIEDAARIFSEIIEKDPDNPQYFKGLVESYLYLNKYEELIPFAENYYDNTRDVSVKIFLGELYWKQGKSEKARKYWDQAIDEKGSEGYIYKLIVESYMNLKLFDDAAETIKLGREKTGDKDLLGEMLIKVYIATGNYKDGSAEIINDLLRTRSLPTAQGRIYALMYNEKATKYLNAFLLDKAKQMDRNILIQELLAWFFRTTGNNEDALDIYIRIDYLTKAQGREILNFAELANKDKAYDIALKAFEKLIDHSDFKKYKQRALLGYAKTLENKFSDGSKMSDERANDIIDRYEDFISDDPKSSIAAEAWYRIGQINEKHFKNLDKALNAYDKAREITRGGPLDAIASERISNILLKRGKIYDAEVQLRNALKEIRPNFSNERDMLNFSLAKIEYYRGDIEKASKLFVNLSKEIKSDIANDAIELNLMIQSNADYVGASQKFALAEYELLKDNSEKAIELFYEVAEINVKCPASQIAVIRIADIKIQNKDYEACIDLLEDYKFNFAGSMYMDKALMILSEAYSKNGKNPEAIRVLSELLVEFPNSIFVQDARNKIRELRGEI